MMHIVFLLEKRKQETIVVHDPFVGVGETYQQYVLWFAYGYRAAFVVK